jgi:hypothetical protein
MLANLKVRDNSFVSVSPGISHQCWRKILNKLEDKLKEYHPSSSICGPFGFELIANGQTAPKQIRKFYIYSNNPLSLDKALYAEKIQNIAMDLIRKYYPDIYEHFIVFIRNFTLDSRVDQDLHVEDWHKLLDIQVRSCPFSVSQDYAHYLMLVHQSILGKYGEAVNYETRLLNRSRVFQFFIMIRALYDAYLPLDVFMSLEQTIRECSPFVDNHIQIFCDKTWDEVSLPTLKEYGLINNHLIPLCLYIEQLLLGSLKNDDLIHVNVECYHDLDHSPLTAAIGQNLYNNLLNKAVFTYQHFA